MKVYKIISSESEIPLAEIRTDGRAIEWTVDNTEGDLPKKVGNVFSELQRIVNGSSHLSLVEPTEPTAHLLRYVLNNGDVAEITTDGQTCLLNSKLLNPAEKQALFSAISSGTLGVAHKADQAYPIPVLPSSKPNTTPERTKTEKEKLHAEVKKHLATKKKTEDKGNAYNDPAIEKIDFSYSDDPEFSKNLLYYIKHGYPKIGK